MTCASFDFNSFHEQNKDPTARTDCLVSWLWLPRIKYSLPPGALIRVLQVLTVLVLAVGVSFGPAFGRALQAGFTSLDQAKSGELMFRTNEPGRYISAPRLGSDFNIKVSGPTARATLTQHFFNPTDGWVEAVYVFPLPENSAVDTMRMMVGKRAIIGEIKERKQARIIYERAKSQGIKAAIVEQHRPNVFSHNVANIGPGETIVIQIEYQQEVRQSKNEFSLRVPLVVAPRFNPKPIVQVVDFDGHGNGLGNVVDPVPDRKEITSPVLDPANEPPINPVTLKITLDAGFPIADIKSHHHEIELDSNEGGDEQKTITLKNRAVPANRDFELTWQARKGNAPTVGLFRETIKGEDYLLAYVVPPALAPERAQVRLPRDVTFVIDTSGSMGGRSIDQARKALLTALDRLKSGDRFNIIRFSNGFSMLHQGLAEANARNIGAAKSFVRQLTAGGGTMMVPPLQAALTAHGGNSGDASLTSRLDQVIFLTDGAIGNETQIFDTIAHRRGRTRVFMVGIGSAPNSHLMERAAEIGRGTFTHIGSQAQVGDRMTALFEKLESPTVTNLTIKLDDTAPDLDITPEVLPDIYVGEPLVVAIKGGATAKSFVLTGVIGSNPWKVTVPLKFARQGNGISKLWARRKIKEYEVGKIIKPESGEKFDARILNVALTHHLVSRLTSLVAVDKTPSRPENAVLTRADVPLNLPDGWDFEKVFGPSKRVPDVHEQRANGSPAIRESEQVAGLAPGANSGLSNASVTQKARLARTDVKDVRFASIAKAKAPRPIGPAHQQLRQQIQLPQTATDAELRIIMGVMLVLLSACLVGFVAFANGGQRQQARTYWLGS